MKTVVITPKMRGLDSDPLSVGGATLSWCQAIKAQGVDFLELYLGAVSSQTVNNVLAAGLGFVPVTFAMVTDPAKAIANMRALGLPFGANPMVTCTLDLEGPGTIATWQQVEAELVTFGNGLYGAGILPALYVGTPQPFTSAELSALPFYRYQRGQGRIVDRFNALAEPARGWSLTQAWPSETWNGVLVDVDAPTNDYHNDAFTMVVADDWMPRA